LSDVPPDGALAEFRQIFFLPRRTAARPATGRSSRTGGHLVAIAAQGPRGLLEGPSRRNSQKPRNAGGIMTPRSEIRSALLRAPVRGNYRGYDIVSNCRCVAGGTVRGTLNILEGFRWPT